MLWNRWFLNQKSIIDRRKLCLDIDKKRQKEKANYQGLLIIQIIRPTHTTQIKKLSARFSLALVKINY